MKQTVARSSSATEPLACDVDALAAEFRSEADLARDSRRAEQWRDLRRRVLPTVVGAAALLVSAGAFVAWTRAPAASATLQVDSDPPGYPVRVDGQPRGTTPLSLPLPAGTHAVIVGTGPDARERRVTLRSAERTSLYHVHAAGAEPRATVAAQGGLSVVTEPAGATVSVDGVTRGVSPIVARDLAPGEHRLVIINGGTTYRRTVSVEPGVVASVMIGAAAPYAAGWVRVSAPEVLQIHENGRLLGTTEADRLMLPTGEHRLELSDDRLGFRVVRTVKVAPGQTATVAVELPSAPVNVNAVPWAEVWIDDRDVGETPIGNHLLPVGQHRIELRHPELGTKRTTLLVSLDRRNRVSVDMREP